MGPCPIVTRDGITLFLADVSSTLVKGSRVNETNSASRMLQLPDRMLRDVGYTGHSVVRHTGKYNKW